MPDLSMRARSITETIDAAFQIYRRAPLAFVLAGGILYAPWLLVQSVFLGVQPGTVVSGGGFQTSLLVTAGGFLSLTLMAAAVTRLASEAYHGRAPDLAAALGEAGRRVVPLLVAALITFVSIAIGTFFFLVGGLYLLARFFATTQVIVLEGRGAVAALGRSSALSANRKLHVLGALALTLLIVMLGGLAVSILAGLTGSLILSAALSTAYSIVAYPLLGIIGTLLYYDARVRSEALDLETMVDALGTARSGLPP